jgi:type II secretion system protein N
MKYLLLALAACGSSTPPAPPAPPPPPVIGKLVTSSHLSGTTQQIRANGLQVPLAQIPEIAAALDIPVSGTADIDISIDVPNGAAALVSGHARATCTKCTLGDDHAKLFAPKGKDARANAFAGDGIEFGHLDFGTIDVDVEVANGRAEVKKFTVVSPDLTIEISGHVELAATIGESVISGCIRFKPDPELAKRQPKTYAVLMITGAPAGDDGVFSIELAGTIGNIKRLGKICH